MFLLINIKRDTAHVDDKRAQIHRHFCFSDNINYDNANVSASHECDDVCDNVCMCGVCVCVRVRVNLFLIQFWPK